MKKGYDFSKLKQLKNPYAGKKKAVGINLSPEVLDSRGAGGVFPGRVVIRATPRARFKRGTVLGTQSDFPRLAGGTMPFMRKYSTICP
jgi:hypothetical protein